MDDDVKTQEGTDTDAGVVRVKEKDSILAAIHEYRDVVRSYEAKTSDRLTANEKCADDLRTRLAEQKTTLENVETTVLDLQDKGAKETKAFWDGVGNEIKNQAVAATWGYGVVGAGPIARAMYAPKTRYNRPMAKQETPTYDVPRELMEMNDFLHLWGLHKTFKATGGAYSEETYRQIVKGTDTYAILCGELAMYDKSFAKALDTQTTNEGLEWIPTQFSAQFIDDLRLLLRVAALFPRINIPMGTGPLTVPRQGGRKRVFLQGEAISDNPTDYSSITPGTGNVTFDPVKHAALIRFSDEIQEDSAVAIAPMMMAELMQGIADAEEDAVVNADTSATHQDSDVTASDDIRKSWTGLRKHTGGSGGVAAVDVGGMTVSAFRNVRKAMGRYGAMSSDLAYIAGVSAYIQMLGITQVLTLDQIGPQATILQGELARFDNSPIIVSEFIREDLTTLGVYDGATTTDTITLLVNTRAFWLADKGAPRTETDRDIKKGQSFSVASRRIDFQQTQNPTATEETVGLGYGITS
ncbi:phage major capsid protein [Marinobacter antarcticus]|uniref:Phage major capsid protein n=1 Tax=Marinobacter antarcticus TaxID=564117 RepID=A0A831R523_9GAMM|nr:phage major capsid protein [Marinobacter antarcticus]HEA52309.1 phage major capsid protein [Marinobacter antarcticus]